MKFNFIFLQFVVSNDQVQTTIFRGKTLLHDFFSNHLKQIDFIWLNFMKLFELWIFLFAASARGLSTTTTSLNGDDTNREELLNFDEATYRNEAGDVDQLSSRSSLQR